MIHIYVGAMASGKDTLALEHSDGVIEAGGYPLKIAFADDVRATVWRTFGWHPSTEDDYVRFKAEYSIELKDQNGKAIRTMTGREYLQIMGTEGIRTVDEDIWLKSAVRKMREHLATGVTDIFITDCRFINEVNYIIKEFTDFKFYYCNYNGATPTNNHESEKLASLVHQLGLHHGDEITIKHWSTILEENDEK